MAYFDEDTDLTESLMPNSRSKGGSSKNYEYNQQISNLSSKFFELKKKSQTIEELHNLIPDNKIAMKKGTITPTIDSYKKLDKEITNLKKNLEDNLDKMDLDIRQKAQNVLTKIEHDLNTLHQKMYTKIEDLEKKSKELNINNEEENLNTRNSNIEMFDSITNQIQIKKLESNSEFLQKRGEDLKNIQQIASQVNSLAKDMNQNLHQQGEMITKIEDNMEEVDKNVEKGLDDIKQIAENQKGNKKKLCFICFAILFVVVVLLIVIFAIFFDKIKKLFSK